MRACFLQKVLAETIHFMNCSLCKLNEIVFFYYSIFTKSKHSIIRRAIWFSHKDSTEELEVISSTNRPIRAESNNKNTFTLR